MTAAHRARFPVTGLNQAGQRAFWIGSPERPRAAEDGFDDAAEAYGEPLRFMWAPSAATSRVPQLLGFAVAGLLAGILLATAITALAPSSPCDALSLRPLTQWQLDNAPARSVRGRVR